MSVLSLLKSSSAYVWGLMLLAFYCIKQRNKYSFALILPLLCILGVCLLGPASGTYFRYLYGISVPLTVAFFLSMDLERSQSSTGAFVGFQKVTEGLLRLFPERNIDLTYTQWDQWESHTIEDHFLGSRGKRVGVFFGGVDDLTYYTPRFETEMSCAVPKYLDLFKGDFAAANMRQAFLDKRDYFGMNAYCAYIGGDYPIVQHRNADAPSDLKVLIIKDSFVLPVQSYLSTVFQEIDVIDPRHYTESTLAEYVNWTKPDLVMMIISPLVFASQKYYDFGEEEFSQRLEEKGAAQNVLDEREIALAPKDSFYHFVSRAVEYGKEYTLTFDDVDFTAGGTDGVTTALYNATTSKLLAIKVYDIAYCRENGGFQWAFRTPEEGTDQLQLLFYAGTHNHNRNNGVVYQGVKLTAIDYVGQAVS